MTRPGTHWLEPLILLFAAGGLVGLIFPITKLAGQLGIQPLTFAGLSAAGASLVLMAIALVSRQSITIDGTSLRYAAIAGQFTFAIPFGILAVVIPRAGSGVPAILQSLAPVFTLAIVYFMGLERPSLRRASGLCIGLIGVLLILLSRVEAPSAGVGLWYLVALVTPTALAAGNVYRSAAWPRGGRALPLATLTLGFAAVGLLLLAVCLWVLGLTDAPWRSIEQGWHLALAQSLCAGVGYAFFFRLQQVGGPVYLSQISYVNTAVGLAFAIVAFGESLPLAAWLAVACIFGGIALVTLSPRPGN